MIKKRTADDRKAKLDTSLLEHVNIFDKPLGKQASEFDELQILIKGCIANDRTMQKRLYDKYAPVVFGIIRRYVDDNSTAKEILNDVFFRVYTKLQQYSFQGAFEGWMRQIAVNIISDHFRKSNKHDNIPKVDPEKYDVHVETDTIGNINYKQLLVLIQDLPPTHRAVFNLYVFENYSHKEIAALLNISDNNSRWHLNDARRRLKERIQNFMK